MALTNIVLFAALCASALAGVTDIVPCPESTNVCTVTAASIDPCPKSSRCDLIRGKNATISFDFIPNFTTDKLKMLVYWANGAVDMPYSDFGLDDACIFTTCPTEPGKKQNLNWGLPIGPKMPKGNFRLKWKVWNTNNEQELCCFLNDIKIKKQAR